MKGRDKMWKLWENIPEDTDILITHTPPRGCLDLSYNRNHQLEFCGCSNLLKNVFRVKPKLHCYGHIHCFSSDTEILTNNGWKNIDNIDYAIPGNDGTVTSVRFFLESIKQALVLGDN